MEREHAVDAAGDATARRSAGEQRHRLRELITGEVAAVLGAAAPDHIDTSMPFGDLGFDSRSAVELRDRLRAATGSELPTAVTFDHPTIDRLADLLLDRLTTGEQATGTGGGATRFGPEEPIAIIGIGCRYPGGIASPEDLWRMLAAEREVISDFPTDRGWDDVYDPEPGASGKSYVRRGGFLDGIADFDADFFGISPREAVAMDPQQRLLLEVSWEALEHARINPATTRGSRTGVYTGMFYHDYGGEDEPPELIGHLMTGTTGSVASGRVAYALGLEGPALTVDTACSSSLVTVHLAAQALRGGECDMALAGGVTVMSRSRPFVAFCAQRGLSPDARCKPYGERADGAVWAEGVGVLVLERLSSARRHGHRVLALVRGSAVNQDGASNGLSAPHGPAQERVVHAALADAGITAAEVDMVEGHGTGTVLGDPIEVQALLSTYGRARGVDPLWLGSIKSNMGHTQGAAGVAGIIKAVMSMRRETMPRTLNAEVPTAHVDWASGNVRLLSSARPWPRQERPRRAGVSSFGISGTNAHVIIEDAPEETVTESETVDPRVLPWVLSGRSDTALRGQARRLLDRLHDDGDLGIVDIGYSLATTRSEFEHRAVVLGNDRPSLIAALETLAAQQDSPTVIQGSVGRDQRSAVLFPGQGAQRPGMGGGLYRAYPVFAAAFDEVCERFDAVNPHWHSGLHAVIFAEAGTPEAALLDRTEYTQPALFTLGVALFALLRSWGVQPSALAGHSIGEITAAYVAGVWSLADACALVSARARLMQALPEGGRMVSVAAAESEVASLVAERADRMGIAAVNSPRSLVLSGDEDAVEEVVAVLAERGVRTQRLVVSHAFHSPRMEPMLAEFAQVCAGLTYHRPTLPIVSTVTGEPASDDELRSPDHWVGQIRRPVRFMAAAQRLLSTERITVAWEAGPGSTLCTLMQQNVDTEVRPTTAALLRAPGSDGEEVALLGAVAAGYCAGAPVAWSRLYAETGAEAVDLPTYPFQRQRYWMGRVRAADVRHSGLEDADHPLLGAVVRLPDSAEIICTGLLSTHTHPWLADHEIGGEVLLPATAFVELALHVGTLVDCPAVGELILQAPLMLPASGAVELRVVAGDVEDTGERPIAVYSRPQDESGDVDWTCHAAGTLVPDNDIESPAPSADLTVWPPPGSAPVDLGDGYSGLADQGYRYGPLFQGLTALYRRDGEVFAEVRLPDQARSEATRFGVHPALLDSALHALALGAVAELGDSGDTLVPFSWEGVRLHAVGASSLRVRLTAEDGDRITLTFADSVGLPVGEVAALSLRALPRQTASRSRATTADLLAVTWAPIATPEAATDVPAVVPIPADAPHDPIAPVSEPTASNSVDPARTQPRDGDVFFVVESATVDGRSVVLLVMRAETRNLAESSMGTPQLVHAAVAAAQERVQGALASNDCVALVTRRAVVVDGDAATDLVAAAVQGLLRSAQSEYPGRILLIDVDDLARRWEVVARALAVGEPNLAVRGGRWYGARLVRPVADTIDIGDGVTWELRPRGLGTLGSDNWAVTESGSAAAPLGSGAVRVAVRAIGVNFRDVLIMLGTYPEPDAEIGNELAGVVLEVGSDVTEFAPGDRVMGFALGVSAVAVTDHRLLVPLPRGWSFAQGAATPVAFATAYHALVELAELERGQTLLVHAATGGVGMAAVGLARHLGATLYATASRPKWEVLHEMGFDDEHIGDSRTLEFERKFLSCTDGRGFDVVLDSLAGEFVDASLRLLPRGGLFLEMGMLDRREPAAVEERHAGVRYLTFHLLKLGVEHVSRVLRALMPLFESGALPPIPVASWDVRRAPELFRFMSQGRHVGKNVLTLPTPWDPDGTVLITGGTGGLGAVAARHLVTRHDVRRLLLVSRRGPAATGAAELVAELNALGAHIDICAADVADPQAVSRLLAAIPREHPLTAVIHSAGVVDDGAFATMTADRLAQVLRPKVDAAWRLHEACADADLAAFVVYSSIAGVVGNPGQSNYAAANAFLDELARKRRRAGLAATSIAWGAWRGSDGMTARLGEQDWARMRRDGMTALDDAHGMALFDAAMADSRPAVVAARLDVAALSGRDPEQVPVILRGLIRAPRRVVETRTTTRGFAESLVGLRPDEQLRVVTDAIRTQAAAVLGHTGAETIDPGRPFQELGFDSLGVLEFRNLLKATLGIALGATVVFEYPTPGALAEYLHGQLAPADDTPARLGAQVDTLAQACARAELDPDDRRALVTRLRAVLAGLIGEPGGNGETADDRELFEFIDGMSRR